MGRLFDIAAIMAACAILAAGCAGPSGPSAPSNPRASSSPSARSVSSKPARIESVPAGDTHCIIAPELRQALRVVAVTNLSEPYLKIQVKVENLTAAPLKFRYRIEWFDWQGNPLPFASEAYIPWTLRPHEIASVLTASPTPAAMDFGVMFVPPLQ